MKIFISLFVLLLATLTAHCSGFKDLINEINTSQNLWRAAPNFITAKGHEERLRLLGSKRSEDRSGYPVVTAAHFEITENSIPKEFDARTKWAQCSTIRSVKMQSDCGSCWAVNAASVMSDRLCITSHHKVNVNISAQNIVSCCTECGLGCEGGSPEKAWDYFRHHGVVTGGDYGSHEGCQPYEIEPCTMFPEWPLPPCPETPPPTPACHTNKCTNKKFHRKFKRDKHYGRSTYFVDKNVKTIQAEIMKHGPVEAVMDVYYDLFPYESGIYKHVETLVLGQHAVRILGWGTEKGTNYWLVANSWSTYWGEKGLFKIIRGTNECQIESSIVAGLVKPK